MAGTQAAQDRHGVDASHREPVRRQRSRHAGQQHGQQCRQGQETAGAIERCTHAALGVFDTDQTVLAGAGFQPGAQIGDGIRCAGEHQPIGSAAAGAEQAGAVDIGAIDQQRRRELHQLTGGIGLGAQYAGDGQMAGTELQLLAHVQAQCFEQARIGIGLARRRCAGGATFRAGAVPGHQQLPAQRVAGADAADIGHLAGIAMEQHTGEADHARALQAAPFGFFGKVGRDFLPPGHAQVAAKHFGRTGGQCERHPVDQGAHCGHHRHAQHQRGEHGQQVPGQEFAAHRARGLSHDVHAAGPVCACRRPLSMR